MMNVGVCMNVHTPFYSFFLSNRNEEFKVKDTRRLYTP